MIKLILLDSEILSVHAVTSNGITTSDTHVEAKCEDGNYFFADEEMIIPQFSIGHKAGIIIRVYIINDEGDIIIEQNQKAEIGINTFKVKEGGGRHRISAQLKRKFDGVYHFTLGKNLMIVDDDELLLIKDKIEIDDFLIIPSCHLYPIKVSWPYHCTEEEIKSWGPID